MTFFLENISHCEEKYAVCFAIYFLLYGIIKTGQTDIHNPTQFESTWYHVEPRYHEIAVFAFRNKPAYHKRYRKTDKEGYLKGTATLMITMFYMKDLN